MSTKASLVQRTYVPGPNGDVRGPAGRTTGMDCGERLRTPMNRAVGTEWFTPDQQAFRDNAAGRWGANPHVGAHAPVNAIRSDDEGNTDLVRLEPSWNDGGTDSYLDLGGKAGIDFKVLQP